MVIVAKKLESGTLIKRENRFVGIVKLDDSDNEVKVHILNPGRMIKFLIPGAKVLVENRASPKRKIDFSLLYVKQPQTLILIDSIIPNKIVKEALEEHNIQNFPNYSKIQPEKSYPFISINTDKKIKNSKNEKTINNNSNELFLKKISRKKLKKEHRSRVDFLLDNHIYIEVKATNYVNENIGYFPDAPSKRAQQHLMDLIRVKKLDEKNRAFIFFIAQRSDIKEIRPFDEIDSDFGRLLREAVKNGVEVKGFSINFKEGGKKVSLGQELPVNLI